MPIGPKLDTSPALAGGLALRPEALEPRLCHLQLGRGALGLDLDPEQAGIQPGLLALQFLDVRLPQATVPVDAVRPLHLRLDQRLVRKRLILARLKKRVADAAAQHAVSLFPVTVSSLLWPR